jgi:hypothetical protein
MDEPRLIALAAHAPGSGKSTVAGHLATKGFVLVPFARPLKEMAEVFLRHLGCLSPDDIKRVLYQDKSALIPGVNVSGRHLLQTLGTEWGRQHISPDVWLQCWGNTARSLLRRGTSVVVDDVRFPDEADLITAIGGELWLVERPSAQQAAGDCLAHASEGGLKDYPGISAVILNNGSNLNDLFAAVDNLLAIQQP